MISEITDTESGRVQNWAQSLPTTSHLDFISSFVFCFCFWLFKILTQVYVFINLRERNIRVREKHQSVVFPKHTQPGIETATLDVCLDWESNPQPFAVIDHAPTKLATRPGPGLYTLKIWTSFETIQMCLMVKLHFKEAGWVVLINVTVDYLLCCRHCIFISFE